MDTITIAIGAGALILGVIIGKLILGGSGAKIKEAEAEKERMLKDAQASAEQIKKDKMLEAKEHFIKLKSEFEEESSRKKNQIITNENKVKQREGNLNKEIENNKRAEIESRDLKEKLSTQLEIVKGRKEEYEKLKDQQINILEKVANISAEDAKEQLIETL